MKTKIRPFIKSFHQGKDDFVDPTVVDQLTITRVNAVKFANGFIAITVNWKSNSNNKYPEEGCYLWENFTVSKKIELPNLRYQYKDSGFTYPADIEVGLEIVNEETGLVDSNLDLKYLCLFFMPLKYGACVYFAPDDWAAGDIETIVDIENPDMSFPHIEYGKEVTSENPLTKIGS